MAFIFEHLQGTVRHQDVRNDITRMKAHNRASALICIVLSLDEGVHERKDLDAVRRSYKDRVAIPRTSSPLMPSGSKSPSACSLMR